MKLQFTKPFNLEHAKAGAPIATAERGNARFVAYEETADPSCCVIVIEALRNNVGTRRKNGRVNESGAPDNPYDLVMLPLGFIDGKPVFVGDEYLGIVDSPAKAEPKHAGMSFSGCKWPPAAPKWPQTTMTDKEINGAITNGPLELVSFGATETARRVINKAIEHECSTGTLVPADKVREIEATARAEGRADTEERDIAIAIKVRTLCQKKGSMFITNDELNNVIAMVPK